MTRTILLYLYLASLYFIPNGRIFPQINFFVLSQMEILQHKLFLLLFSEFVRAASYLELASLLCKTVY